MPVRHTKAAIYASSGLFSDLQSFAELETRIENLPSPQERGDAFEVFAEAYFAIIRRADFAEVYPQNSASLEQLAKVGLTAQDLGADGVAFSPDPFRECAGYQGNLKGSTDEIGIKYENFKAFTVLVTLGYRF